jgi:hypothetical protein
LVIGNDANSNVHGGCSTPKMVIRQDGEIRLEFYLVDTRLVFTVNCFSLNWDWFDPTVVQYLYEPGQLKHEPPYLRDIKTITTVSPDPCRYKEFSKAADVDTLYFPLYSKEELVAIGTYMKDCLPVNSPHYAFVQSEFTVEGIEARFRMYGGVFRRVLPGSLSLLMRNDLNSKRALADAACLDSMQKMLGADMIDSIGSYLVQWSSGTLETKSGALLPFRNLTVHFTSEEVYCRVRTAIDALSYETLCQKLLREGTYGRTDERKTGLWFERFVVHHLKQKHEGGVKYICRDKPCFADMIPGTIYHPVCFNEPAFDAYYKERNGKETRLVLIQCSWTKQQKVCKHGAFAKFLIGIAFEGGPSDIHVVYARGDESSKWELDRSHAYAKTE